MSFINPVISIATSNCTMSETSVLEAWWMPASETALWEFGRLVAIRRVIFIAGIFILLNSMAHSIIAMFFRRSTLTREQQILAPHYLVEWMHCSVCFYISLRIFLGLAEDSTFVKHRIFCYSISQEFLSGINTGFAVYSIGNSLLSLQSLRRSQLAVSLMRGGVVIGLSYLNLIYPCVLGARLRVYWNLTESAILVSDFSRVAQYFKSPAKIIIRSSISALLLCLIRFWIFVFLLMWSYRWVSSEYLWSVPNEVPVAEITHAYLTGVGLGSLALTYFAFHDFSNFIKMTKEWSAQFTRNTLKHHKP